MLVAVVVSVGQAVGVVAAAAAAAGVVVVLAIFRSRQ